LNIHCYLKSALGWLPGLTILLFSNASFSAAAESQPANMSTEATKSAEIFLTLQAHDHNFFERSFNQCDVDFLDKSIAKDFRMYHDKGGAQDRKEFFNNVKKNICANPKKKPIRRVEEGSLRVFPLFNNEKLYGAIQHGVHHFYLREPNVADVHQGTANFTHLYLLTDGQWILKEALSYDHTAARETGARQSFEQEMDALLKQEKVPALGLGIIQNGKLTQVKVFGELKAGSPAPYNALFKVASLTKPLTAMVALSLANAGKLDLDEPLDKYWTDPDIKNDERRKKLTARIVLSHQTGFPNWRHFNESKKLAFEFEPGTKHQYSGEGFEYLRKSIEKKFGKSLEDLAHAYIFKPAKMNDTHFWWNPSVDENRYALNHNAKGEALKTEKYYVANAAANVITTVEDYGNFLAYVLSGAGLSDAMFVEMTKNQVYVKERSHFGLGWEKLTDFSNGEYALLHSGRDPGVNTLAVLFPKSKNGYVIFLNGDNAMKIYEALLTKHLHLGAELWDRK
jgi:CubicO group peptidase (beta-lactamase class C family)